MTKVTQLLWARSQTLIFWLQNLVRTSVIYCFYHSSPMGAERETTPMSTEPTPAVREQHGPFPRWDICLWWGLRPQHRQACNRRKMQVIKYICPSSKVIAHLYPIIYGQFPKFSVVNFLSLSSDKIRSYIQENIVAVASQKMNSSMSLQPNVLEMNCKWAEGTYPQASAKIAHIPRFYFYPFDSK